MVDPKVRVFYEWHHMTFSKTLMALWESVMYVFVFGPEVRGIDRRYVVAASNVFPKHFGRTATGVNMRPSDAEFGARWVAFGVFYRLVVSVAAVCLLRCLCSGQRRRVSRDGCWLVLRRNLRRNLDFCSVKSPGTLKPRTHRRTKK